ncbi:hypothetical protein [Burkholderia ubonensis]|uniref:hypothetical protein n=1 Tax=Burkholderia ubonensis TaxID=101571 RepID=UPI0015A6FA65|nr:hypothetical protein [Burkholderia ubonensis]
MFVAFSDASETKVTAIFDCEQDLSSWPHQGELQTSDPRYATFFSTFPLLMQASLPQPSTSG